VHGHAEVVKVEGRRVAFQISVCDEIEEIGRGTHARMVIDVARFMKRLDAKAAT
jgi:fluoroacetyl-CoA thioesterase